MAEFGHERCEKVAVLVHRFQWCTQVLHEWLIAQAHACDILCVVLGSTQSSPSAREPLPLTTRQKIREVCTQGLAARLVLLEMPDLLYQPQAWGALLQRKLDAALGVTPHPEKWIASDAVPKRQWQFWFHHPDEDVAPCLRGQQQQLPNTLLAAEIDFQRKFFDCDESADLAAALAALCFTGAQAEYVAFHGTLAWQQCQADYQAVTAFKAEWACAPYTPIFHTVDALVKCRLALGDTTAGDGVDYVLLIKRGRAPGKDLWAIPGGFLEAHESRYAGALRELREETCLDLSAEDLQLSHQGHWVVDAPRRSARGRILTTLYVFDLGRRETLPTVVGADDAAQAQWVTLDALKAEMYFEDHCFLLSQASLRFGWSNA